MRAKKTMTNNLWEWHHYKNTRICQIPFSIQSHIPLSFWEKITFSFPKQTLLLLLLILKQKLADSVLLFGMSVFFFLFVYKPISLPLLQFSALFFWLLDTRSFFVIVSTSILEKWYSITTWSMSSSVKPPNQITFCVFYSSPLWPDKKICHRGNPQLYKICNILPKHD